MTNKRQAKKDPKVGKKRLKGRPRNTQKQKQGKERLKGRD